jgi:head-tail adaptor
MDAGKLHEAVSFREYTPTADGYGGQSLAWSEHYACRAQFIYHRGGEALEGDRLNGQATYKVKVRSCADARAITQEMRMVDTRRGVTYNIREVDAVTDRHWVYIVVEQGVVS